MLCQICGKNVANIHYKSLVNGVLKEIYMCSRCASEKSYDSSNTGGGFMRFFENKFSDRAEQAIKNASVAAQSWSHKYIGTEHLLFGLLCDSNSIASNILEDQCNINAKAVQDFILENYNSTNRGSTVIGFSPAYKRTIENSYTISRQFRQNFIGAEHILIALLSDKDCAASRIISQLGGNIESIYDGILNAMGMSSNYDETFDETINAPKEKKNDSKTPNIDKFGKDLTKMAGEGKFDPVIGREKEIERVIDTPEKLYDLLIDNIKEREDGRTDFK